MTSPTGDLQVACAPSLAPSGDIAFLAERQRPAPLPRWVLYITSDQVAVDIHRVVPAALGEALHGSGALGLLFPAGVTSVQLEVAAGGGPEQHWQFWIDDDPDVTEVDAAPSDVDE
jgi:hypothetical protein